MPGTQVASQERRAGSAGFFENLDSSARLRRIGAHTVRRTEPALKGRSAPSNRMEEKMPGRGDAVTAKRA
jgi:hypothetical protein